MTKLHATIHTKLNHGNGLKLEFLSNYINLYNNILIRIVYYIIDNKIKYNDIAELAYNNDLFESEFVMGFRIDILKDARASVYRFRKSGKSFTQKYPKIKRSSATLCASMFKITQSATKHFDKWVTIQAPSCEYGTTTIPFFINKQMNRIQKKYKSINTIHIRYYKNNYYLHIICERNIKTVKQNNAPEIGVNITHLNNITGNNNSTDTINLRRKLGKHKTKTVQTKIRQRITDTQKATINKRINWYIALYKKYHIREQSIKLSTLRMIIREDDLRFSLSKQLYSYYIKTLIRKLQEVRCSFDLSVFGVSSDMKTSYQPVKTVQIVLILDWKYTFVLTKDLNTIGIVCLFVIQA